MGRAPCCDKNGLKKGPWTPEEDQELIDYIQKHGYGNWRTLPKNAGLQRCGKSCRLRWTNYLRPDIKRGRFSFEEEETIIQLHSLLGNKWSAIAARLPGRTDNEIKNYWNTHIRKRLLRMGIDPVTHSPRLDLLDLSSILGSSIYGSSHQMNMSRLMDVNHHHQVQPQVNLELLRLATSLISSSSQGENPNFIAQNGQQNQLSNLPVENQYNPLLQTNQFQSQVEILPCSSFVPFSNVDQYLISPQNSQLNHDHCQWDNGIIASSLTQDYVALSNYCNNNYYGSDQTGYMDSNNSNQNFSFASVISSPSSSPTPLNSNSTYLNGSSTTTSIEDERDSYCSNLLKFEIPDILDVDNFM